jgi:hypothetical protein
MNTVLYVILAVLVLLLAYVMKRNARAIRDVLSSRKYAYELTNQEREVIKALLYVGKEPEAEAIVMKHFRGELSPRNRASILEELRS